MCIKLSFSIPHFTCACSLIHNHKLKNLEDFYKMLMRDCSVQIPFIYFFIVKIFNFLIQLQIVKIYIYSIQHSSAARSVIKNILRYAPPYF